MPIRPTRAGQLKEYLSFKIESQQLRELPLPKPLFEIFVFSPRMEGVHLRMGYVARGGIRWSDRREDFRTEVLGLMKAQQVKNTVIVPVGAKGGFVVRRTAGRARSAAGRSDRVLSNADQGTAGYHRQHRRREDRRAPPRVVRHDRDDAYLVVAADKGTATFSDIANAISEEYGFWLGDAFASGGSAGYDHKKMAITARGAWECVKRHFREMGVDIQSQDFSVAGIGDMAGRRIRQRHAAIAAHPAGRGLQSPAHLHRSAARSPRARFAERERLFKMPRSSLGGLFARARFRRAAACTREPPRA